LSSESHEAKKGTDTTRSCLACGKEFSLDNQFCPVDGSPLTPLNIDPLVGSFFAERYQILSTLGRGGMSSVYKARHTLMDRIVAIKILVASDVPSLKRFQLEAKLVSSLKHHNIVTVYDFGVSFKGQPYLVMDYLEGSNLMEEIRKVKRLELMRATWIFCQACDALNYAHKRDLIHRDLKPSNFMLVNEEAEDVVKLVDFGIAKHLNMPVTEAGQLTHTGQILGSPLYMSPEQCMGNRLDARSDIYSLGCVMYETLTGKPPLLGTNTLDTLQRHIHDTPLAFASVDPDLLSLPEQIEKIVLKCLQREPDDRYQTILELWTDIELFRNTLRPPKNASQTNIPAMTEQQVTTAMALRGETPASTKQAQKFSWAPVIAAVSTAVALGLMFIFFYPRPAPVPVTDPNLWKKLNEAGELEFNRGHYVAAQKLFRQANEVAEDYDGQDPRYATSLNNLGNVYFKEDFYPEAEHSIKKALAIRTDIFGQNGLPVADSMNDLAMVYFAENKHAQAEPLLNKALTIRKTNAGVNSLEYADSLKALAAVYNKTGRVDQAMRMLQTVLSIRKKQLGSNNSDVAEAENSLAMDYQIKGDLKQARNLYKNAENVLTKTLGPAHPLVADSLVGLASIDFLQNNFDDSEKLFNQALQIRVKALGEKNLRTGEILSCLAVLKQAQGQASAAEPLFKKALEIKEVALGPDSPEVARSMKMYAVVLHKLGKSDQAAKLETRAKEIESGKS
jgi:serine/threonine protein kinase/Tfp pilus assembly protein PilF